MLNTESLIEKFDVYRYPIAPAIVVAYTVEFDVELTILKLEFKQYPANVPTLETPLIVVFVVILVNKALDDVMKAKIPPMLVIPATHVVPFM
jgi:hypothetical protein